MYGNYYSYGSSGAGIGAFVYIAVMLAFVVFAIAVPWRIISKSGDKGWKSLIPIYGSYVYMKAVDSVPQFWAMIGMNFVNMIFSKMLSEIGSAAVMVIWGLIVVVVDIVLYWRICKNTAECFEKSSGFAVGLFFLPVIFQAILAFGSAEHYNQRTTNFTGYDRSTVNGDSYSNNPTGTDTFSKADNIQENAVKHETNITRVLRICAGAVFAIVSVVWLVTQIDTIGYWFSNSIVLAIGLLTMNFVTQAIFSVALFTRKTELNYAALACEIVGIVLYLIYSMSFISLRTIVQLVLDILFYLFAALGIKLKQKELGIVTVAVYPVRYLLIPLVLSYSISFSMYVVFDIICGILTGAYIISKANSAN